MKSKWIRTERTVNPADPTEVISWVWSKGKFKLRLVEFFGDVSSSFSYNGKELLFTSRSIHKKLNKIIEMRYNYLEHIYQEDKLTEFCEADYDCPRYYK